MASNIDKASAAATGAFSDGDAVFSWVADAEDLAEIVEAVESVGWRLDRMSASVTASLGQKLVVVCLFRR